MAYATVYDLPENGDHLIGQPRQATSRFEDNFASMSDRYDVGFLALAAANPDLNPSLPGEGTSINLPVFHILPDAPRRGIVINLAEFRLYYFGDDDSDSNSEAVKKVHTFPIGIGKAGWETPVGNTHITRIVHNPTWTPPQSIVNEYKKAGATLPAVVPAGPDNPLGQIALRLALPGYLLHGTNNETGVGMRVSHGCLRMRNRDVAVLASLVKENTPVSIVNQPIKAGWHEGDLYIEAHRPLDDVHHDAEMTLENIRHQLSALLAEGQTGDDGTRDVRSLTEEGLDSDRFFTGIPFILPSVSRAVETARSDPRK